MAIDLEHTDPKESRFDLATLQVNVCALLAARLAGQVEDVELVCRDDVVVIQGFARSYYAKQMAEQVVREAIPECQAFVNELKIF
jgi:hypothetical protein